MTSDHVHAYDLPLHTVGPYDPQDADTPTCVVCGMDPDEAANAPEPKEMAR